MGGSAALGTKGLLGDGVSWDRILPPLIKLSVTVKRRYTFHQWEARPESGFATSIGFRLQNDAIGGYSSACAKTITVQEMARRL
jgi:hypothetical protein